MNIHKAANTNRMKISIVHRLVLLSVLLFGVTWSYSQSLVLRRMDKSVRLPPDSLAFVKVKDLREADRNGLLDPRFLMFGDTLETLSFHGCNWFRLKNAGRKWDEKRAVELFAYCDSTKQLWQITHHYLFWSSAYGGSVEDLYLHSGRLFATSACYEDDPIGHVRLLVVDAYKREVSQEVCLKNAAWLEDMYSVGDSLHVILAPIKRKKNPEYLWELLSIRGGPASKWLESRNGFSWHVVLNVDFTIVRSEEMDKNATDFDKYWWQP